MDFGENSLLWYLKLKFATTMKKTGNAGQNLCCSVPILFGIIFHVWFEEHNV
jgi:hypothetical protein